MSDCFKCIKIDNCPKQPFIDTIFNQANTFEIELLVVGCNEYE